VSSPPGEFPDGNVFLFAFTSDPRAERAQRLLARGCSVGVQALKEFTTIGSRRRQTHTLRWPVCVRPANALRPRQSFWVGSS
jgi:hypothetical protein